MTITDRLGLSALKEIPRGVWMLGLVSLFMDVSSEMIHALLPIYLVTVLGTSTLTVGIIEGMPSQSEIAPEKTMAIEAVASGGFTTFSTFSLDVALL